MVLGIACCFYEYNVLYRVRRRFMKTRCESSMLFIPRIVNDLQIVTVPTNSQVSKLPDGGR